MSKFTQLPRSWDVAVGLNLNFTQPGVVSATAAYLFTVIDQAPAGENHVHLGRAVSFSTEHNNWGYTRFIELAQLRRTDRRYLAGDRLLVRVELSSIVAA